MKKMLIVESPAKAKTIGKYLGSDFVVKSSVGHVRDLPKKGGLSIKIESVEGKDDAWIFMPKYEITPEKKKVVAELRATAKACDEIYLAPDPDREGEAIAWHLNEVLADITQGKKVHRVTYNEITKKAVLQAIENPREIDLARVDAQQSRRILDRLVGFQVSPLLWKYLNYGHFLSAGRVQSAALRIIVEREREIQNFVSEEFWLLGVEARKDAPETVFTARLSKLDGEKQAIKSQEAILMIVDDLDGASLVVKDVAVRPQTRHPYPPFTTSTLQQAASSVCGFSPGRTMTLAQKLYEEGLITYMRTDSVNIAAVAQEAAAKLIAANYGQEFLPPTPNFYKSKAGAQEAHEAIRPTDVTKLPGTLNLDATLDKLYRLIWNRFVASQMASAQLKRTTVTLEGVKENMRHTYQFSASCTQVLFEGFLKVAGTSLQKAKKAEGTEDGEADEVKNLPDLHEGDKLVADRWLTERKETKPPARFSEAALVKQLEENGVGRPSTYAQTIETLDDRQYVTRHARQLMPTQRGLDVNDWLVKKLEPLFNVGYTAEMEAQLDKVEAGEESGNVMLSRFFKQFRAWMEDAKEPAPPKERFESLFVLLDNVKQWKKPVTSGKRVYDDQAFIDSVRRQVAEKPETLTQKQLQALVRLAITYRDQIPDGEMKLIDLGFGLDINREKNAPSDDLVKWCFQTIDRIGGLDHNPFLNSLREQVDRGRGLTVKQFTILARTVGENAGALEDCEHVRQRLSQYSPDGFDTLAGDPAVPELIELLSTVKTWREPVRRGRRVYNDLDFVSSLRSQYARRKSLSPRQALALRRVVISYKDQIPTFDAVAERLGLDKDHMNAESHEKMQSVSETARADALADVRAERRHERKHL